MRFRSAPYSPLTCLRCGRRGHEVWECFASAPARPIASGRALTPSGVYVLRDGDGRMYVGKSGNIPRRIEQHLGGEGTQFLGAEIKRVTPYTTGPSSDLESWERNETLARMRKHGIAKVRGWMFTSITLTKEQAEDAFRQICEKYDLCRRCGRSGHFATQCPFNDKAPWARG
jgi:hypothetical protein